MCRGLFVFPHKRPYLFTPPAVSNMPKRIKLKKDILRSRYKFHVPCFRTQEVRRLAWFSVLILFLWNRLPFADPREIILLFRDGIPAPLHAPRSFKIFHLHVPVHTSYKQVTMDQESDRILQAFLQYLVGSTIHRRVHKGDVLLSNKSNIIIDEIWID
ncbi:hypothetical protein BD779DRAFT_327761 [Infundibulicybe gibba]|nr:hypothetical protein BD779DRAFT_327761 [Infundibulicybe gibba]